MDDGIGRPRHGPGDAGLEEFGNVKVLVEVHEREDEAMHIRFETKEGDGDHEKAKEFIAKYEVEHPCDFVYNETAYERASQKDDQIKFSGWGVPIIRTRVCLCT